MPFTGRRQPTLSFGRLAIGLLVPFGMKSTSRSTKLKSSENLLHFQSFHPSKLVCLVCFSCGNSHFKIQGWAFYNCFWWWLEVLRSIRRTVKTGGAPGNTHCSRSGIHISSIYEIIPTLNYLRNARKQWWFSHVSSFFKRHQEFLVIELLTISGNYFSWFLEISHITSLFLDWTPIFAASLITPKSPNLSNFHIIISFVNHDQECKSWWKMVGWDEPCPHPRSAQVAISGSFFDEQNDHLEADFFDKETSLKQDRSVWQYFLNSNLATFSVVGMFPVCCLGV